MPGSSSLTLTDLDQHREVVSRTENLSIIVTEAGKFWSEFSFVELDGISVDRGRMSLPRIIRGAPKQNLFRFHFPTLDNRAPAIFNGVVPSRPYITFSSPGAEFVAIVPGDNRWGRLTLSLDMLASASRAILGYEIPTPVATNFLHPKPEQITRLQHAHMATMQLAATAPQALAHLEVAKAVQQELLRALITCIGHSAADKK